MFQLYLSLVLLVHMFLLGEKHKWSWYIGIAYQLPYTVWLVANHHYGLLVSAVPLSVMCFVNLRKWREQ